MNFQDGWRPEVASARRRGTTLYLRGLPVELARAAKAAAAERGITLAQSVAEALQEKLAATNKPHGMPEVARSEEPIAALQADMEWFEANRARLLETYGGKYVAIVGRSVLDADVEFAPLARRVFERFGLRPVFMPKITPTERAVHVPSPRVVKR